MIRPNSIVWFERLYLGSLVVGAINLVVTFDSAIADLQTNEAVAEMGWGAGAVLISFAISLAVSLLIWYFITRKGSVIAKWFMVAFTIIGLLGLGSVFSTLGGLPMVLHVAITALEVAAAAMLFRSDARPWFGSTPADPGTGD